MSMISFYWVESRLIMVRACMLSHFSCVWFFATPWTVTPRLLCSWDSSDNNSRVGCHAFRQGNLPDPGIESPSLHLLHLQAVSLPLVLPGKPSLNVSWVIKFVPGIDNHCSNYCIWRITFWMRYFREQYSQPPDGPVSHLQWKHHYFWLMPLSFGVSLTDLQ